jgi:nucleoside-diphosphate-sugar epimerase
MSVAVTGASGFIGRHLVAHLVERGFDVRAIVRARAANVHLPGATVVGSPLETPGLVNAFSGADTVVHLAGVVGAVRPEQYRAVNVEGTRAVAEASRMVGARLIHISSLAVAGPATAAAPSTEDDPANPISPYGASKLEGEQAVRSMSGLRWTILRPGVVYGPGDRGLLPLFHLAAWGVLPRVGPRDAAYTLVHVSDVVQAIEAAATGSADGRVLFVGHPRIVTVHVLAEGIASALGRRAIVVPLPRPLSWLAALAAEGVGRARGEPMPLNLARLKELWAPGFVCRVDELRDRLGVVAQVDLAEGLAGTGAWYRREGWL